MLIGEQGNITGSASVNSSSMVAVLNFDPPYSMPLLPQADEPFQRANAGTWARFVRVSRPAASTPNFIHFHEIQAFDALGVNVLRGKQCTSSHPPRYEQSSCGKAVDGVISMDPSNYDDLFYSGATADTFSEWDLGALFSVRRIVLYNRWQATLPTTGGTAGMRLNGTVITLHNATGGVLRRFEVGASPIISIPVELTTVTPSSSSPSPTPGGPCLVGSSAAAPAYSCAQAYDACGVSEGLVWIQPIASAAPYRALCTGQGWTLAMKTAAGSGTLSYGSGYWSTTALFNSDPAQVGSVSEGKYQPYNELPVNALLLVNLDNGRSVSMTTTSAVSLLTLMNSGYSSISAGRNEWLHLFPWYNAQPYCNVAGINTNYQWPGPIRLGMNFNEQNDCGSCDTWVGIGMSGHPYSGSNDRGQSMLIYVKGPFPTPPSESATPSLSSSPSATVTMSSTASPSGLPGISGRVVEIRSTVCSASSPSDRLATSEIVVMTRRSLNLARSASVTTSSSYASTPATFAIDGIIDQSYPPQLRVGNFWSASIPCSEAAPQWIRLVLPQYLLRTEEIVLIDIYNRGLDWCGDCQQQGLVGAVVSVYQHSNSTTPLWSRAIIDAALRHTFRPGLTLSDPLAYVHDTTAEATSTLNVAPPSYATPSQTASITATQTQTVSPSGTKSAWRQATGTTSTTRTPTQTNTPTSSPTATTSRIPITRLVTNISGLSVYLRLEDIQSRGVGNCVTNWPNSGYLGGEAYVVWNACPYLASTTELNGFRPARFDVWRSMKFDVDYSGRSEFSLFYLGRALIGGGGVLQSDNTWIVGWWDSVSDALHMNGWLYHPSVTWDSGWNLYGIQFSRNGPFTFTRNGQVIWTWTNDGSRPGIANILFNWGTYQGRMDFYLGEVLAYDRRVTDEERRVIEGHLLWKTGLQSVLPANHPYASDIPYFPTPSATRTPSSSSTASWSTGASQSSSSSATATVSMTPTVVPLPLLPGQISGLAVWLDLAMIQSRGVGNCVTNWPNSGYLGGEAYVVWNACPYLASTTELNGFRPAQFDTSRSLKYNIDYRGQAEFSLFYLARMNGNPQRIMQGDNNWLFGWHGNNGDQFYFSGWLHSPSTTWNLGWVLYGMQLTRGGNTTLTRNGQVLGTFSSVGEGMANIVFSWGAVSDQRSDFYLGDVIVYDRRLDDGERQAVEASILWRYGLQSQLPSGHLYYASPPAVPSLTATPTATISPTASWSTGASKSSTRTPSTTLTPSQTVIPVPAVAGNVSGLSVYLRLEDIQSRGVGSCVTNWPNSGYLGGEAYVVWNACPYLASTTELNGFRPAQFDTSRSLKYNIDYSSRSEFSLFYLARMNGNARAILQSDNGWFVGWWDWGSDRFHFGSWTHNPSVTWNIGWALYGVQYSRSGQVTLTRNGVVLASFEANPGWPGISNLVFNWGTWVDQRSDFYLAEVALYDRRVTDAERQRIESSVLWKAGLQALLPSGHPYYITAASQPSLTNTPTGSSTQTPSVTPSPSLSATRSLGATPTPTFTQSPGHSDLCPGTAGSGWYRPLGSGSCYKAASADLAVATTEGVSLLDGLAVCRQLSPLASLARFRIAEEAAFVVRGSCGARAASSNVTDDGFGVWIGLVGANVDPSVRSRAAGWTWGGVPYVSPQTHAGDYLYTPDGQRLWLEGEPNNIHIVDDVDDACVHVTPAGELDDVPCWTPLKGVCCEVSMATPTQTASSATTASTTASSSSTATMTSTSSPSSSVTPVITASATATMTPTSSSTASVTASVSSTASVTATLTPACKPEYFAFVSGFAADGVLIGYDAAADTQYACQLACCRAEGCTAFSLSIRASGAVVPDTCSLFSNVTQLVPIPIMGTGLLHSALPSEVTS